MQNKKLTLIMGILTLFVAVAAFLAGKMFTREIRPSIADESLANGRFSFSSSNNITPAAELPTTPPEISGLYVEHQDHTMMIHTVSFDPGIGGILGDSVDVNSAPKVEIILTGKTTIYRNTTEMSPSSSHAINQTVEASTPNELIPPTMITVWGRKSGDRIIADVLLFSNSLNIQKP
jgi:hypothetical protein